LYNHKEQMLAEDLLLQIQLHVQEAIRAQFLEVILQEATLEEQHLTHLEVQETIVQLVVHHVRMVKQRQEQIVGLVEVLQIEVELAL